MTSGSVLVVEDDAGVAELYARFLESAYDVLIADTVEGALGVLLDADEKPSDDSDSVDAVLLDRRLPDGPGSAVLDAIRDHDLDCRVAMVTGVRPGFDIVDMGFDLYVVKPVSRSELLEAVDTLFVRSEYDGLLRKAAALASKRALLESRKSRTELDASEEYQQLLEQMVELDADLMNVAETFTREDYRVMFRDLGRAQG